MALIAHYKLDGNAKDAVANNHGEPTSGVTWVDGKLGKAAQFDGSSFIETKIDKIPKDPKELSVAFWAKADFIDSHLGMIGFVGDGGYTDGFVITTTGSSNVRVRYWTDGGTNLSWDSGDFANQKESHFCVTLSKRTFKVYQDGVKVQEGEHTNPLNLNGIMNIGLYTWQDNYFYGWIDDVRLYDHALSKREIRDLSLGLALHYSFNEFQEPTENIKYSGHPLHNQTHRRWRRSGTESEAEFIDDYTVRVQGTQTEDTSNAVYYYPSLISGSDNPGAYYSFSAKVKITDSPDKGGANFRIGFRNYNNSEMYYFSDYRKGDIIHLEHTDYIEEGETVIPDARLAYSLEPGDSVDVLWYDMQVEKKERPTPFVPIKRNAKLIDNSSQGYVVDLPLDTSPSWREGGPTGSYYFFDGTKTITPENIKFKDSEDWSVCLWVNIIKNSSDVGGNSNAGIIGNRRNSANSWEIWHNESRNRIELELNGDNVNRERVHTSGIELGQWYFLSCVYHADEKEMYIYLDGNLVDSGPYTDSGDFDAGRIIIGQRRNDSSRFFYGNISDLRIYSTPLSSNTIKELMDQKASLDSNKNIHLKTPIIQNSHKKLEMDYTIWEDGQTGSVGKFNARQSRNHRRMIKDPWGRSVVAWEGVSVEGSTSDTGIYYQPVPVDNTKMYRYVFWERRVSNSDASYARYYFGLHGYGSTNGVYRRNSGALSTNPYFYNTSNIPSSTQLPEMEWVLMVGHIWPAGSGTGEDHPDSGRYLIDGTRLGNISRDWVWHEDTETARPRTLAIYRPDAGGVIHQTIYPRIDVIDGTEPSIQDLVSGFDSRNYGYLRDKANSSHIPIDIGKTKTVVSNASEVSLTNGLVAWYPLIKDTDDYIEREDADTEGGSITAEGYEFIRDNEDMLVVNSPISETSEFTWSAWVNLYSFSDSLSDQTQARGVLDSWSGGQSLFFVSIRSNRLRWFLNGESSNPATNIPFAELGKWYLISGSYSLDTEKRKTYIDGELVQTSNIGPCNTGVRIGRIGRENNASGHFDGLIKDVRVYNRALLDKEVALLYETTREDGPKASATKDCLYVNGVKEI